jgi:anti-anti-sigma factor
MSANRDPSTNQPLAIEVKVGAPVVVTIRGDLDLHTVPALRKALGMLRDDDVIIDCGQLRFLDSTGVAVLVETQRDRERAGRSMNLRNVANPPRRTLEICGLIETLGA